MPFEKDLDKAAINVGKILVEVKAVHIWVLRARNGQDLGDGIWDLNAPAVVPVNLKVVTARKVASHAWYQRVGDLGPLDVADAFGECAHGGRRCIELVSVQGPLAAVKVIRAE